ncbi:hypothetical protein J2858_003500 [Neorhizobium galegae]|uniref:hypothetical protein n=1 Tax=Neorhizobium galegae TaxID=399 RepID=UPI001FDA3CE5|nr:hypothetical protein [Neorhizobium galegae]MBP2550560.1 hypothetical protein [Neorhizobium galegae]
MADHERTPFSTSTRSPSPRPSGQGPDGRDRLILALYAQLKAERETREAIEWAARNGGLSSEVLAAMAGDPVPVITDVDVAAVERLLARERAAADDHAPQGDTP